MTNQDEVSPAGTADTSLDAVLAFSDRLLEKRYANLALLDGKINTLATLDSLLLAALLFLLGAHTDGLTVPAECLLGLTLAAFGMSIFASLLHMAPRLHSGTYASPDVEDRFVGSVVGTLGFANASDMTDRVMNLDVSDMIRSNCAQVRGMGVTIARRSQLSRIAALGTGLGMLSLMGLLVTVVSG